MLMKMADIISNLTYATIGAFIALILKEFFSWKGQGRTEAIKRYETLLIECYGILLPIISKLSPSNKRIVIKDADYNRIEYVHNRFSFRIPQNIEESLSALLYEVSVFDVKKSQLEFSSGEKARDFWIVLDSNIRELMENLKYEIRKLESYTQSISSRIWYIFMVWNFKSKKLLE